MYLFVQNPPIQQDFHRNQAACKISQLLRMEVLNPQQSFSHFPVHLFGGSSEAPTDFEYPDLVSELQFDFSRDLVPPIWPPNDDLTSFLSFNVDVPSSPLPVALSHMEEEDESDSLPLSDDSAEMLTVSSPSSPGTDPIALQHQTFNIGCAPSSILAAPKTSKASSQTKKAKKNKHDLPKNKVERNRGACDKHKRDRKRCPLACPMRSSEPPLSPARKHKKATA